MKKNIFIICLAAGFALISCGSKKSAPVAVESTIKTETSLEGNKVRTEVVQLQGIDMSEALNEEGTAIEKRPYKWYAGTGKADNKQVAIELAQREAYATISRVLNNAVLDGAERGNVANNGKVQQALTSHWEQVSQSLIKSCEPYGAVAIEYDPTTRMYSVVAKVAIRGDKFNQLLKTAGDFKPENLSADELEQFIETNKSIMEAAKGN